MHIPRMFGRKFFTREQWTFLKTRKQIRKQMDQIRNNTVEDEPSAMGNNLADNSETLRLELNSEARSLGSGDRGEIDESGKCRCTRGAVPFRRQANDGGKARCSRCGKEIEESEARSRLNSSQLEDSSSTGPLAGEVFTNGLPSLPYNAETNREGNNCATGEDANATGESSRLPTAEQETRTPIHSDWNSSVQIPHEGTDFTYYVSVQDYPATKEQCFSMHFVSTSLFWEKKVAKRIQEQQEVRLVPIGDEYLFQREIRHFHTAFIDTHMDLSIKFQLVSVNGKFIIMHARTADKASLQRILALGQHRIPGAIANVFVKCIGNPGEPCEDHLRVILQYGDTTRHMLFSFWSSG